MTNDQYASCGLVRPSLWQRNLQLTWKLSRSCKRAASRSVSGIGSGALLAGFWSQLLPKEHYIWLCPSERHVESLCIFPYIRNQVSAIPRFKFSFNVPDQLLANISASGSVGYNEYAEVGTKADIMGTDKAQDLPGFLPNEGETIC